VVKVSEGTSVGDRSPQKADVRHCVLKVREVPRTVILRTPIHHREGELVDLGVCGLNHGRPFFDFGLVVRGKRLRRLVGRTVSLKY
jgi:hypothetical protein